MARADDTDIELIAASRRGERAAFGELITRCGPMVEAVTFAAAGDRALGDRADIPDVIASACADEHWSESHRSCLMAATSVADVATCRVASH